MKQTTEIGGVTYSIATITAGAAKGISFADPEPYASNTRLIEASLRAGGHSEEEAKTLAEGIPVYLDGAFAKILAITMEVNGLKPAKGDGEGAGETKAATESTGDSSTAE